MLDLWSSYNRTICMVPLKVIEHFTINEIVACDPNLRPTSKIMSLTDFKNHCGSMQYPVSGVEMTCLASTTHAARTVVPLMPPIVLPEVELEGETSGLAPGSTPSKSASHPRASSLKRAGTTQST